jgi:hypothetical protein
MIVLTETTDNLQAVLGGSVTTNQLNCFTTWRDITTSEYTPGRTVVNTNNTTDVNIVPAPTSSTKRIVDTITIYNKDTVSATVTIKFDANGTEYILFKATLAASEIIEYTDGAGFKVFSNAGSIKNSINQGNNTVSNSLSSAVLGSDQTNNNASANTMQDVTGLSFSVTSTKIYWFRFIIQYTSAATTTGSRWAINGPANSLIGYTQSWGLSAVGTSGTDVFTQHSAAAYDSPASSNATSPTATSGQANIAIIEGFITPSADGTVVARFASEISGSAIVAKAGSVVYYQQLT